MNIVKHTTYEDYLKVIENKETIRKALLDIRFQIAINKFNPEVLTNLTSKEQELINEMKKNMFIIKIYEIENNIERGKENDQHKRK